jgi:hypothetical protein
LVRDSPTANDAWDEVDRKQLRKRIHPTLSLTPTFGEIAQHWRVPELKRDGALSRRARETMGRYESLLDGYVLPKWASMLASEIVPPLVEFWFEELASQPVGMHYPEGKEPPKGYTPRPLKWTSVVKIKSVMSLIYSHALRNKLSRQARMRILSGILYGRAAFAARRSPITKPLLSSRNR